MSKMEALEDFIAKKIVVKGLVQGIGYRPFVAELAETYGITGWVRNTAGIVTILAEGKSRQMEQFLSALSERKPEGARVDALEITCVSPERRKKFTIEESERETAGREIPFIPPDPAHLSNLQQAAARRLKPEIPSSVYQLHLLRTTLQHHRAFALRQTVHYDEGF